MRDQDTSYKPEPSLDSKNLETKLNQPSKTNQAGDDLESDEYEAKRLKFREELKKGLYLQLSEEYLSRGKWTEERVGRDIWQNFFDANNYTLDGLNFEIKEEESKNTIHIEGGASYDFTRLLAFGVGHKENYERSAGGESEGTRIMALHMLRDLGFSEVKFASENWELEFYFDKPPTGKVPRDKRHLRYLYAKLRDKTFEPGNSINFSANNKKVIESFLQETGLFITQNQKEIQSQSSQYSFESKKILNIFIIFCRV